MYQIAVERSAEKDLKKLSSEAPPPDSGVSQEPSSSG